MQARFVLGDFLGPNCSRVERGREQMKPAARAADIFCPHRNGPKMRTGYRTLEMREGKHPLRAQ